jgi:precorrin-6A/cobalt-precorrin-6A reductase
MRVGGFGGAEGLARWLEEERIAAVVDATHPFAVRISANAADACARLGTAIATLVRPPWRRQAGDDWRCVASVAEAVAAVGPEPARVFLAIGRQEVGAFTRAPRHSYLARTIDLPEAPQPGTDIRFIRAAGPFNRDAEIALFKAERIEVVVAKNSGGTATYAKIEAARALGLPVVMVARPAKPGGEPLADAPAALAWLVERAAHQAPSDRGV